MEINLAVPMYKITKLLLVPFIYRLQNAEVYSIYGIFLYIYINGFFVYIYIISNLSR